MSRMLGNGHALQDRSTMSTSQKEVSLEGKMLLTGMNLRGPTAAQGSISKSSDKLLLQPFRYASLYYLNSITISFPCACPPNSELFYPITWPLTWSTPISTPDSAPEAGNAFRHFCAHPF